MKIQPQSDSDPVKKVNPAPNNVNPALTATSNKVKTISWVPWTFNANTVVFSRQVPPNGSSEKTNALFRKKKQKTNPFNS